MNRWVQENGMLGDVQGGFRKDEELKVTYSLWNA